MWELVRQVQPRPTLPVPEIHCTNGSRHAAQNFSRLDTILADTWGILYVTTAKTVSKPSAAVLRQTAMPSLCVGSCARVRPYTRLS